MKKLILFTLVAIIAFTASVSAAAPKNVLVIIANDLNDWFG